MLEEQEADMEDLTEKAKELMAELAEKEAEMAADAEEVEALTNDLKVVSSASLARGEGRS